MSVTGADLAGDARPVLSDREFQAVCDLLYERAGLYFADAKRYLVEGRVRKRMAELHTKSAPEYLALLKNPVSGREEMLDLLDAVTTHETSFFRHMPQVDAFRGQVLPQVLHSQRDKGRRSLRIWSAACSSGEEPYTLAMLVIEALGPELGRWNVQILGTDIARSVLQKASEGIYNRYSFRGAPAYFIQKYFEPLGAENFRLKEGPRRLVTFQLLNFADEARMRSMRGFQVIFCRNALIYFDRPVKQRFVGHFFAALEPGGYFFAGHSESLHGVCDAFKLIHLAGALAYRRPLPETDGSSRS